MTSVMHRRTFMGTPAGGLLAAPLSAEAQQPARRLPSACWLISLISESSTVSF